LQHCCKGKLIYIFGAEWINGPPHTKFANAAVDLAEGRPRILSLGLIVIYLVSLFLHHEHLGEAHHFHGDATEQCHDHASVDPCHQAIYHAGLSECDHDVHLFESIQACEVCDLLLTKIRDIQKKPDNVATTIVSSMVIPGELPWPVIPTQRSKMLRAPPGA